MDRAHRIGQTREVHIYRFVSSHTVEENMLKKANQKRLLDRVVIQEGDFTTEFFGRMDWRDMLDDEVREAREKDGVEDVELEPEPETEDVAQHAAHAGEGREFAAALAEVEDEEDAAAARVALGEGDMDFAEFDEGKKAPKRREESEPAPSGGVSRASVSAIPSHLASSAGTPTPAPDDNDEEDEYDDDDVGGVDEYMLRFVEWDWDYFSSL
jgi:helicase SWR1